MIGVGATTKSLVGKVGVNRQAGVDYMNNTRLANMIGVPCVVIPDHDFNHDIAQYPANPIGGRRFYFVAAFVAKVFQ
jgi:hypothetical protein